MLGNVFFETSSSHCPPPAHIHQSGLGPFVLCSFVNCSFPLLTFIILVFIFYIFIKIHFTHFKIHPLNCTLEWFLKLCNHHHDIILEHFSTLQKETPYKLAVILHFCSLSPYSRPRKPLSCFLSPVLDISHK